MIDLYTWSTPNGYKVSMMLEETGLDYTVHPIDIGNGAQSAPEFQAISPNGRIPAIVDGDLSVFEWLMFQMAHIGPMIGQLAWFTRSAPEPVPLAIDRYMQESARLLNVMDKQLGRSEYIAGSEYSIADIALYGWVSLAQGPVREAAAEKVGPAESLDQWLSNVGERPATVKGMQIPAPS
jgi:GST-like protein